MTDVETSYQANTVEELRDELRARNLHTSGNKDELIARLEEDDAAGEEEGEAEATAEEAPELTEPAPEDYYPPIVYSAYELPANTAAAQAFIDAHPENVTQDELEPGRHELAQANIQDHVDSMAASGVTVEDPRLEGYTPPETEAPPNGGGEPPPSGPQITSLTPDTAATGQQVTVTVAGSGFDDTSTVEIDGEAQTTTFVDAAALTVTYRSTMPSGMVTFTVRNGDDQESNDMPFNVTAAEPEE
jgi:hypothetical protein